MPPQCQHLTDTCDYSIQQTLVSLSAQGHACIQANHSDIIYSCSSHSKRNRARDQICDASEGICAPSEGELGAWQNSSPLKSSRSAPKKAWSRSNTCSQQKGQLIAMRKKSRTISLEEDDMKMTGHPCRGAPVQQASRNNCAKCEENTPLVWSVLLFGNLRVSGQQSRRMQQGSWNDWLTSSCLPHTDG